MNFLKLKSIGSLKKMICSKTVQIVNVISNLHGFVKIRA
jgi:hypothetical protein